MSMSGTVLKYEDDDINTDIIWPGKYTYIQVEKKEMKKYAMETFDPDFRNKTKEILVVGKNFGCGSSREQASECLKYSGVKAIIAKSFSRIFFRNSLNIGLPVIESAEAYEKIQNGDYVKIDLKSGTIILQNNTIRFAIYPKFVMNLISEDGLINFIRKQNQKKKYKNLYDHVPAL